MLADGLVNSLLWEHQHAVCGVRSHFLVQLAKHTAKHGLQQVVLLLLSRLQPIPLKVGHTHNTPALGSKCSVPAACG